MTRSLGNLSLAVVALATVVLSAQLAEAQGGGGQGRQGRRGFGGGQSSVALAANPQVQELLKLTDAQKTKVSEINDKLRTDRQELFQGGGGGEPGANLTEMAKLNADAEAKVAEALDATQNTNLLSVLIQVQGGPALANAQLAKELKLDDAQKSKVAELAGPGARRGGGGMRDATPEERAAAQAEREKQFTDILTADQQSAYAKIKAAQTVDSELLQQLSRGGGGRRRGGGGGGGM
jgi:hypothetical protein